MAHNLNVTNGSAAMFYNGERPWHGLGTQLDKLAVASEAINAANLGWRVEARFMQAADCGTADESLSLARSGSTSSVREAMLVSSSLG